VNCGSSGAFGEAWFASASLSAKLYSVPGFNTGKGGTGIIEGGGVSISVRWIGTGGGTGCTAIETEWCWEQPATIGSISNALDCTAHLETSCLIGQPGRDDRRD
jgi:hypothetical protein